MAERSSNSAASGTSVQDANIDLGETNSYTSGYRPQTAVQVSEGQRELHAVGVFPSSQLHVNQIIRPGFMTDAIYSVATQLLIEPHGFQYTPFLADAAHHHQFQLDHHLLTISQQETAEGYLARGRSVMVLDEQRITHLQRDHHTLRHHWRTPMRQEQSENLDGHGTLALVQRQTVRHSRDTERDHRQDKGTRVNHPITPPQQQQEEQQQQQPQQQQELHRPQQVQACEIHSLQRKVDQLSRQVSLLESRRRDIEARMQIMNTTSYNGILVWRIPDIARRRREAVEGRRVYIKSPPFYTSRYGYKMCLRVYLNGDGSGNDTHISIFFVLMRGDFDALLQWPFEQKVTLNILDQTHQKHLVESFQPDPKSSSFHRPQSEMNIASGCPLFAPVSILADQRYVTEDTMFIKAIVDTKDLP